VNRHLLILAHLTGHLSTFLSIEGNRPTFRNMVLLFVLSEHYYKIKNSRRQVILVTGLKNQTSHKILLVGSILTSDIHSPQIL